MKLLFLSIMLFFHFLAYSSFEDYFKETALRIDYFRCGDMQSEEFYIDELKREYYWAGSRTKLIDSLQYGHNFLKVFDLNSGKLIYSRGYSTLFKEWQMTDEAKKTRKCFSETIQIPFPKNDVCLELFSRNKKGVFEKKFEYEIDIESNHISKENYLEYPLYGIYAKGKPAVKVDILILPDGYNEQEMEVFIEDCKKFKDILFSYSPFKENQEKFNIRCVLAPSRNSGTDFPGANEWKKTILNSRFNTFGSERYCMTTDNKKVRDIAAHGPYDQIYILVNTKRYGGGAIYNHYALSGSGNLKSGKVFVHEFGHSFASLADEYVDTDLSYNDIYPLDIEPYQPNITTLIDFDSKWKNMLMKRTPIPTPDKRRFDDRLGVFEGAGYKEYGIYRPSKNCMMRSLSAKGFCPVCQKAILEMIDVYAE